MLTIKRTLSFALLFGLTQGASAQGMASRSYEFPPNKPTAVDNPVFWELSVKCKMNTPDAENLLIGKMKKKSGKINGVKLKEGQETSVVIKNNDTLHIVSDGSARVEITNKGNSTVKARCST